MAKIALYIPASQSLKVIEAPTDVELRQRMIEYMRGDSSLRFYRISPPDQNGDIVLSRIRPVAGSERFEQVLVDVEFRG